MGDRRTDWLRSYHYLIDNYYNPLGLLKAEWCVIPGYILIRNLTEP